jgi:transcriptional regulator with GAF, ATPase, and Fis domain
MDTAVPILDRGTLHALIEASGAILSESDFPQVLRRIAERAAAVLRARAASVLLLDAERRQLVFHAASSPDDAVKLVGSRFDASAGIAGRAVRERRAVRVDDAQVDPSFFKAIDAKTRQCTHSLIAAPLIHRGEVLGVVEVLNPTERPTFSDADAELIQVFANLAAAATAQAQALDRARRENKGLRAAASSAKVVGESPAFKRALELCQRAAPANTTVLLLGETGTGKEVMAHQIHALSPRRHAPFIAINCAALPQTLLESELFGHEKGAFTGAGAQRPGRFELADGGTLMLDEVGEMSPPMQAELLRVLEERQFVRVGGTRAIPCDVRVIAATNRDLKRESEAGRFRMDLYYRLAAFPVELPPLRGRLEDLPLLVEYFLTRMAPEMGAETPSIAPEALACLRSYRWPGNLRELRNVLERCVLLSGGIIQPQHLPPEIAGAKPTMVPALPTPMTSKLEGQEREMVLAALESAKWNQSAAARALGVSRDHLRYRMKKYGLEAPDIRETKTPSL